MMRIFCLIIFTAVVIPLIAQSQEKAPSATKELQKKWQLDSIMFDKMQIEWINKAIKSHDEGVDLSILLPEFFSKDKSTGITGISLNPNTSNTIINSDVINTDVISSEGEATKAPVFYLSSILYIAPDNWSVWINGKKISFGESYSDSSIGDIEVVNVTENNAIFIWKKKKLDHIYSKWKQLFNPDDEQRFFSNNQNAVVDSETGSVSFILGVNQSFDSYSMQIYEGEVKTKTLVHAQALGGVNIGNINNENKDLLNENEKYNKSYSEQIKDLIEALKTMLSNKILKD